MAQLMREVDGPRPEAGSNDEARLLPGNGALTLSDLLGEYEVVLRNRSHVSPESVSRAAQVRRWLDTYAPALAREAVGRIEVPHLETFAQLRQQGGTRGSTINRDLRVLRAALKLARPGFALPTRSFLPERHTRVRKLDPEEARRVFSRGTRVKSTTTDGRYNGVGPMPSPIREMAQLAALTFMRQGELRTLPRAAVQLDLGIIDLEKAKAGSTGHVVLSEEAQRILRGQLEEDSTSPWVFPNPKTGKPYSRVHVSRVFKTRARALGLHDFTFHDLRHHAATVALENGATVPQLKKLGRWKREAMVERYTAVGDDFLRAVAESVSQRKPLRELLRQGTMSARNR
ncbi:MAG: site-specific integrase [Candidatus Rokubacteria bacterium]|nr:site-specific integrase [Candidatus Rokubacteria bacterium]